MNFILTGPNKGRTVTYGAGMFPFVDGVCQVPDDEASIAAADSILVRYHGAVHEVTPAALETQLVMPAIPIPGATSNTPDPAVSATAPVPPAVPVGKDGPAVGAPVKLSHKQQKKK